MRMTADDFAWVTRKLMESAEKNCDGRLVAVLEGRGSTVEIAAITLNAAAAIAVATDNGSMEAGVTRAREAIRSGAARAVLERLRKASGSR